MKTITHDGKEYEFDCYENGKITYKEIKKDFGLQGFDDREGMYFVQGSGSVDFTKSSDINYNYTTNFRTYPNEDLAHKASKLMKISNAFIKACLLVDPDFEPDFSDFSQAKYRVYYDFVYEIFTNIEVNNAAAPVVSGQAKAIIVMGLLESWGVDKLINSLGDK